jgi:hypothetical protein
MPMPSATRRARAIAGAALAVSGLVRASVDPSELRQRIGYLASEALAGRATGSEGGRAAARYVAEAFRKVGLKPLGTSRQGDVAAPLDGSGYFQPFEFTAGVAGGKGNSLFAQHSGRYFEFRPGTEFVPSSVSGNGSVEAEAVFAGYGIVSKNPPRDDYGNLDVKGRVVLLLAGFPGNDPRSPLSEYGGIHHKVLFARDRGAAAVLVAATRETALPDPAASRGYSNEGIPVLLIRRSIAEAWLAAAGWTLASAEARLASGSLPAGLPVRVSLSADVQKVRKPADNVAGILEGSDPVLRGEYVVIGAHYDHLGMGGPSSLSESGLPAVHPGADDNASGAAGVIALAEEISRSSPPPRRSVVFLEFSGEELGLLGSAHYAAHPLVPNGSTVAMINMDMIGRLHDRNLTVVGTATSPAWQSLLAEANRAANPAFALKESESGFGASDHQSFYEAKIPVLFFFTGNHPDYHKPSDTADKINAEGEAEVLDFVARCARPLVEGSLRPVFRELPAGTVVGPTRFRVWFGSVPDYSGDVEGLKISGVRAGSPAQKAGVHAGDIVVRFGSHQIRNLEDYTIAISEHRPGDEVDVTVRRGTGVVTLRAVLESPPTSRP